MVVQVSGNGCRVFRLCTYIGNNNALSKGFLDGLMEIGLSVSLNSAFRELERESHNSNVLKIS